MSDRGAALVYARLAPRYLLRRALSGIIPPRAGRAISNKNQDDEPLDLLNSFDEAMQHGIEEAIKMGCKS